MSYWLLPEVGARLPAEMYWVLLFPPAAGGIGYLPPSPPGGPGLRSRVPSWGGRLAWLAPSLLAPSPGDPRAAAGRGRGRGDPRADPGPWSWAYSRADPLAAGCQAASPPPPPQPAKATGTYRLFHPPLRNRVP